MSSADALSSEDVQALTTLVVEFQWRRDHGQTHTLPDLVTEEFQLRLSGKPVIGKPAFIEWADRHADEARVARHVVTNTRFASDGQDRATGTSTTLTFIFEELGSAPKMPFKVGEYVDTFVKQDGAWKMTSRTSHRFGPGHPPIPA